MKYKEHIAGAMSAIAKDNKVVFIGYNVRSGFAGGTLKGVDEKQLIETPVAENLMSGMAIGLSIQGFKPVVYVERMDFLMNAMDAIVNHLDKIEEISQGVFSPKVIFRCVVGNKKVPLFTGSTHTQNFCPSLRVMLPNFNIVEVTEGKMFDHEYKVAMNIKGSSIIVEYKDLYAK